MAQDFITETQNDGTQFKTYGLFISGTFHLVFQTAVDHG